MKIYSSAVKAMVVYATEIIDATSTSKGTGNTNTEIDITDVTSSATNMLHVQITNPLDSTDVYGGYVTIEPV